MINELLDIVDGHDRVIGQKYKTEVYQQQLKNFRVINAFLLNNKKEVWIPRRSPQKMLFPLCLDASVGGHVITGETYTQAFGRELHEELNIKLNEVKYRFIAKLNPYQHNTSAYMHMYLIYTNTDPQYGTDEFISASWITISKLQKKIQCGEKTKSDLPILINVLQNFLLI